MVWGMAIPDKFSEFWPEGQFDEWRKSLMSFFLKQPLEVQKALFDCDYEPMEAATYYPTYVYGKFKCEIGSIGNPEDPPFTPISEHEPPRFFDTVKN